uniref:Esterase n=3 Tax=Manduca sexta TaxID=7130 RepID=A0A977XKU7_MANSE|nr:esterase [Manduca sexta]
MGERNGCYGGFTMITLMLLTLLVGSHAQLSGFVGSLGKSIQDANRGVVNTITSGANNGATAVVDITKSAKDGNIVTVVASGVKKEAGAVAQPVESVVLLTATSQCELVKKALGVDYASARFLKDDDLNQLKLEFITPALRVTFNITQAAELIPAWRGFDPELPLIIIAHGFMSDPDSGGLGDVLDAFHKKGQYNVLALDSSAYIRWFYLRATTYVRYIGEKLGEILAAMVQRGLNPNKIHLIGHSLGAHISGFTGKEFTRLTGHQVGRISGLDPAGPCFFNAGQDLKLNATDATFVDVIHTTHGSLGITEPAGHSDFYPNGGTQQPDCVLQTCSHGRAWYLYKESILNPTAFVAVPCDGWSEFRAHNCKQEQVLMGYSTPQVQGLFFLQTDSASPYGLGEAGATYANTEGVLKSIQPLGPGAFLG